METNIDMLRRELREEKEKNALLTQQLFMYYDQIHELTAQKEKYKLKLEEIMQKVSEIEMDTTS